MSVTLIDNSDTVREEFADAILRALTRCGIQAETFAKEQAPVDTGNLRNSITHAVDTEGNSAIIGTNVEYAPHQELGTIHMQGRHFLRNAVAHHAGVYRAIALDELKK